MSEEGDYGEFDPHRRPPPTLGKLAVGGVVALLVGIVAAFYLYLLYGFLNLPIRN